MKEQSGPAGARRYRRLTRGGIAVAASVGMVVAGLTAAPAALAVSGAGVAGPTSPFNITGVTPVPGLTGSKPEHKIWSAGGYMWAQMASTTPGQAYHIFKLVNGQWKDTGVPLDNRPNTSADTLWNGNHLFVASHVVSARSTTLPGDPQTTNARLYRFKLVGTTWVSDAPGTLGYLPIPTGISAMQSLSMAQDSKGRLFLAYTKNAQPWLTVSRDGNPGDSATLSFATPFRINWAPTADPKPQAQLSGDDDVAITSANGFTTMMWSNQRNNPPISGPPGFYSVRRLDTSIYGAGNWSLVPSAPGMVGAGSADNHINMNSDGSGRVYAAVKTSRNDLKETGAPIVGTDPLTELLIFTPNSPSSLQGTWSVTTVTTVADGGTRPVLALGGSHVQVFYARPSSTPPTEANVKGSIYEKDFSQTSPVAVAGAGTLVLQNPASDTLDDPTTSRQPVTSANGFGLMAYSVTTKQYWYEASMAPVAAFTSSLKSSTDVQFTDTSANLPTSWSWNFGDGGTSTLQNPTHSYVTGHTYTVKLTVTNEMGTASVTNNVMVGAPVAAYTVKVLSNVKPYRQFLDASTGSPTAWLWSFGDGTTSTLRNPVHLYPRAGVYAVVLKVSNAAGISGRGAHVLVATVPGAPTQVSARALAGARAVITYRAAAANAKPIKQYTAICYSINGGRTRATNATGRAMGHPIVVAGLSVGKTYRCTVTAYNSMGRGPASGFTARFVARR